MINIDTLYKDTLEALEEENIKAAKYREDKRIAAAERDLRENAAYQTAVEALDKSVARQFFLNNKLKAIQALRNLNYKQTGYISIGSIVTIQRNDTNKDFTFQIVPNALGNAKNNLISDSSLLGKSILGKQVGETALVNTGIKSYTVNILSIT